MEWMASAQWKATSTYQQSTITMKRNRNRDMYTVLLAILHTARENNVFENNIEEDIPKFSNLVLCFSFISIELFFYLNSELT